MERQAERGPARSRPHGGVTPEAFVWWLRGYFEATGTADNIDFNAVRDMLAHVPFEAPPPARLQLGPASAHNTPCGCGGTR